MQAPYTDHPAQAFAVAQLGTGVLLTLAATRPLLRVGRATCATWLASVWLLVLAPELADLLHVAKLSFLPWALVLQLAALLAARGAEIVDLQVRKASLEEVFLGLTQREGREKTTLK